MTILEGIRNYFLGCPLLKDGCLNVDYLEPVLGYNIDSIPMSPIVKKYTDGGSLRQFGFIFSSREAWGNDTITNLDNNSFYEELCNWIESNNLKGNVPGIDEGDALKVEITSTPFLMSCTEDTGIYQIQARLIYYKKGRI